VTEQEEGRGRGMTLEQTNKTDWKAVRGIGGKEIKIRKE
jgi:hypothetical protein